MEPLVVDLLQKKLEKEINEVLKQLELQVDKVEFRSNEKLALVINLRSNSW
ncbi:MAG: hypothetical protein GX144_08390 [Clostridiaceae bacterium]|jgi:hypothetical protein|nr:hypothetical protein [Clostridiaceae bacterium]